VFFHLVYFDPLPSPLQGETSARLSSGFVFLLGACCWFFDLYHWVFEEVARIFGIPSHMLMAMDKATFNNIEVMSLDFVKNTLRPICVMLEQEFNRKLFTEREHR